ncbi:MAG: Peptidase family, partial [Thermoleophilaceae bacterium]|nr:Peptidase family [Thermoleophilaceae bacterium]
MRSLTLVATLIGCLLLAPPAGAASSWRWPVEGRVITPYHNGEDPYAGGQHRGIDIAAPAGTGVVAASAGTVTFAGVAGSSGLTVSIRTDEGTF